MNAFPSIDERIHKFWLNNKKRKIRFEEGLFELKTSNFHSFADLSIVKAVLMVLAPKL
jgi:hypothetical protein